MKDLTIASVEALPCSVPLQQPVGHLQPEAGDGLPVHTTMHSSDR
jgi:hypothetical protein